MRPISQTGSRHLVWAGSILLLLAGVMAVLWLARGGSRSGEGEGSRSVGVRDGTGAGAGDGTGRRANRRIERDRARAAMRGGRFSEAWGCYRALGDDSFEAEDLFTMGSSLLERGRVVLGWTALEAARRVDSRHVPSIRALDDLESKRVLSQGREQVMRHEAADAVEFLSGVRGGPALGMLVLGLAGSAEDEGREADFLDRLLIRDHRVLRAVTTPAEAIKLVARLLMETARPAEAGDLLRPLVTRVGRGDAEPSNRPDVPAGAGRSTASAAGSAAAVGTTDREAAWLLGRAALQLDQDETADALLDLAGGFGEEPNLSPEPAPFVGSRRCAECHRAVYQEQQRHSPHARTISSGSALKDVPLPARPVPDPVAPGVTHRFRRSGDDRIELETRAGAQVVRAVITYAVGSGRHGITMVAKEEPLGVDRELRISYFATDQTWGETKGIDALPHDLGDSIGPRLSPKALRQCLHCHSTWFRAANPLPSVPRGPEVHDQGIGCERCHGPGLNHIKAVESGFAELAIAQTPRTPPAQLLNSCNECHASNGSVEPNDPEFTRVQGTTLKFSRCFTGSQGRIHCATCHNPHRGLDTSPAHYEAKCLTCHPAPSSSPPHHPGPPPPPTAVAGSPRTAEAPACPVNPAGGCISCHMPKVEDPSRRARFTDHHIRIHRRPGAGGG